MSARRKFTLEVLLVGGQGLDGSEECKPVLCKDLGVGHDLPVSLNLSLASVEVNCHIESVGNVVLDDVQEPA